MPPAALTLGSFQEYSNKEVLNLVEITSNTCKRFLICSSACSSLSSRVCALCLAVSQSYWRSSVLLFNSAISVSYLSTFSRSLANCNMMKCLVDYYIQTGYVTLERLLQNGYSGTATLGRLLININTKRSRNNFLRLKLVFDIMILNYFQIFLICFPFIVATIKIICVTQLYKTIAFYSYDLFLL